MLLTELLGLSINGLLKHTAKQTIASLCLCPEGSKEAIDGTLPLIQEQLVGLEILMVKTLHSDSIITKIPEPSGSLVSTQKHMYSIHPTSPRRKGNIHLRTQVLQ